MSAFRDQTESYNSPTDVARLLGKHPNSVIRWIMQGALLSTGQKLRLQAVRSPGGWLIQKSWVDAFLADLTADRQRPVCRLQPERAPLWETSGDQLSGCGAMRLTELESESGDPCSVWRPGGREGMWGGKQEVKAIVVPTDRSRSIGLIGLEDRAEHDGRGRSGR